MKKRLTCSLLAIFLIIALCVPASAATIGDINGNTYQSSITEMQNLGGLTGLLSVDGNFNPTGPCSRKVFATMLNNLYTGRNVTRNEWYTDTVATQSWACQVMETVSANLGYRVSWSGGAPSANIDRAEACGMIINMLNCDSHLRSLITANGNGTPSPAPGCSPGYWDNYWNSTVCGFSDVHIGDYYAQPVAWAVDKGITGGTSKDTFSPSTTCTVAQVLTFLWRANGSPKVSSYYDCPFPGVERNTYYYDALRWAGKEGLIQDDKIDPSTAPCTRSYVVWCMWKLAGSPSVSSSYASGFRDIPSGASYAKAVRWAMKEGITSGTSSTTFSPMETVNRAGAVTFLYRHYATNYNWENGYWSNGSWYPYGW